MAPTPKECDYLVIGGGSGGIASARRASGVHGAKTIVVESKRLGGTCVNVGCVPKKVTWYAAALAEAIRDSKAYGFSVEESKPFDWPTFKRKRDEYVRRLNGIYERNLHNDKIEYIHGRAQMTSPQEAEIKLEDGTTTTVRAKKVLLATGGFPTKPQGIEGSELGITSDGFFDLAEQPRRVALVGAGYIAVEMAGMLHSLGSETHLFIRHDTFLRNFDPMISEKLTAEYERVGVHLHKRSSPSKVEKVGSALKLHYKDAQNPDGATVEVDQVLWAIGRRPDVADLHLHQLGIEQTNKGYVAADEFQNTNVDGVYALGDLCGKIELTPVAIAAGRRLADRLFGGPKLAQAKLDYNNIPSVVFAHPEAGSIGLTEPQAREKYGDDGIKVYTSSFSAMLYSIMPADDRPPTSYKIVCAGPDEKVVGLHILGLCSSEIMQGFGVAVKMGATKKDLDNCVAIHPTSAEELVTMK